MAKLEFIIAAEKCGQTWTAYCPALGRLGVVASANTREDAQKQAEILAYDMLSQLVDEGWTEHHLIALGILRPMEDVA